MNFRNSRQITQPIASLFLYVAGTCAISCAAATVTRDANGCDITIKGEIDGPTLRDFQALCGNLKDCKPKQCETFKPLVLWLDSGGGDVEEAVKLGDFVRKTKFTTYPGYQCASACVLVFIAGVDRIPGLLGLHRPYSTKLSSSESESKSAYERVNKLIREYLSRMNIPGQLLDTMNAIPPDEILWTYDIPNLKELHLFGEDPVYADTRDSEQAKLLGISKRELYVRRQKASDCYVIRGKWQTDESGRRSDCYQAAMLGISKQEYDVRRKKAIECNVLREKAQTDCRMAVWKDLKGAHQ